MEMVVAVYGAAYLLLSASEASFRGMVLALAGLGSALHFTSVAVYFQITAAKGASTACDCNVGTIPAVNLNQFHILTSIFVFLRFCFFGIQ